MKRSNVNKTVAVLAAVGVMLTACSGGDDDAADEADGPAAEEPDPGDEGLFGEDEPSDSDRDAEDRFTDEPAEEPVKQPAEESAEEPMEEPAAEEPASEPASESSGRTTTGDAEGGLFGAEPEPPDDARLEDNTFADYGYRDFVETRDDPLSTFALDVDTGSYSVARRWLDEGQLPPPESVRPEEYVNAFDYDYDAPRDGLEISVDGGPSPFDADNHLIRIGVQGEVVDEEDRGEAALTFVIDTSGSMDRDDRLGLVKESLSILVDELDDDDTVAIVT